MCIKCGINPIPGVELDADCRHSFWVEAPLCLLTDFTLIPRDDMTLEEKMNTITRIVLIVWILLRVFKVFEPRKANLFLIIALVVIVLLYYARRRRLQQEAIARLIRTLEGKGSVQKSHQSERRDRSDRDRRNQSRVDSDDESSDSDSDSSESPRRRRHQRHHQQLGSQFERFETRAGNQNAPATVHDGFQRFEATAGNGRHAVQAVQRQYQGKNNQDQPVHTEVDDADAAPEDLPEEEQIDVDQELVQAPITRKAAPPGVKRNPRKPYPPVVSPSIEVRAAREENLMKSYRGANSKAGSKFHGYQTKNFQDDEGPSIRYVNRRLRGTSTPQAAPQTSVRVEQGRRQQKEATEEEHFEVMAENEDAEDEIEEQEREDELEDQEEMQVRAPARVQVQAAEQPKRRVFLPANYDGFIEQPPVVKNDRPKLTRHGAMKGHRVPAKYADSNKVANRMDASELMFNRAAKLEKATNARLKASRNSQVNGMFGI